MNTTSLRKVAMLSILIFNLNQSLIACIINSATVTITSLTGADIEIGSSIIGSAGPGMATGSPLEITSTGCEEVTMNVALEFDWDPGPSQAWIHGISYSSSSGWLGGIGSAPGADWTAVENPSPGACSGNAYGQGFYFSGETQTSVNPATCDCDPLPAVYDEKNPGDPSDNWGTPDSSGEFGFALEYCGNFGAESFTFVITDDGESGGWVEPAGCVFTIEYPVIINPPVSSLVDEYTIAPGDCITLDSGLDCSTLLWSTGDLGSSIVVCPAQSTTYSFMTDTDCSNYQAGTTVKVSSDPPDLTLMCPSSDTIYGTCLPTIPDILLDNTSNNNEDQLWFESLDMNSDILTSINTVVIRVNDQNQMPLPQTCADFLIVKRIIQIYDGNPSDPLIVPQTCELIYKVTVPFYLQRNSFPAETVVACDGEIATAYSEFLDNFGYADYDSPCSEVINDVTNPDYVAPPTVVSYIATPVVNPNGCGSPTNPGNGFITVLFWLIDECGHTINSVSTFKVVDDVAPTFTSCPPDLSLELTDPNLLTKVSSWLDSASAVDNCQPDVNVSHDFEPGFIDLSSCSEQSFSVNFSANDACGNANNNCSAQITVVNNTTISIMCPGVLSLECGDQMNENTIDNWIATVRATDALGQNINQVTNNIDLTLLSDPACNTNLDVIFTATDACGQSASCQTNIIIQDTTSPTLACPANLFLDPFMSPNWQDEIPVWLSSASATDNCGSAAVSNNYSVITAQECGETITEQITFSAQDQCGNFAAPCVSMITVFGSNGPQISCPSDLVIECGDSNNNSIVMTWLESSSAFSSSGVQLAVSYGNFSISEIDVFTCLQDFSVSFSASEDCMGNLIVSNCSSTIRIQDTTPPQLSCPPPLTINSNASDNLILIDQWLDLASATDNCSVATLSNNYSPGNDFCNTSGPLDITFNATDNCGFSSTACIGRITINQDSPIINCPGNLVLECGDPNNLNEVRALIATVESTDNAGTSLAVMNNFNPNQITNTGCSTTFNITFSSTDACTMTASCTVSISINDTTRPSYINGCPPTLNLTTGMSISEKEQAYRDWIAEILISDCNPTTLTDDFDTATFTVGGMDMNIPVNFELKDTCGLAAEPCVSSIVIIDDSSATNAINPIELIRIFPNPTTGLINLRSEKNIESVAVSDINGRIIYEKQNLLSKNERVNLANARSGIYFIRYQVGGIIGVKKIIRN